MHTLCCTSAVDISTTDAYSGNASKQAAEEQPLGRSPNQVERSHCGAACFRRRVLTPAARCTNVAIHVVQTFRQVDVEGCATDS